MNKVVARTLFWLIFLLTVGGGYYAYWMREAPQQTRKYLSRLSHPNANVATEAYRKLNDLYHTKWAAYEIMLNQARDITPIHFLVEIDLQPDPGKPSKEYFTANGKTIFHKSEKIYCRTVGDAILTLAHNERKWIHPFGDDWDRWWEDNKTHYGY